MKKLVAKNAEENSMHKSAIQKKNRDRLPMKLNKDIKLVTKNL